MVIKRINSFACYPKNFLEEPSTAISTSVLDSPSQEEKKDLPSPICLAEHEKKPKILLVGKKKLAAALQKQFDELGLFIRTVYDPMRWARDSRIYLPNETHLIPAFFSHKKQRNKLLFHSLLPENLLHFYFDDLDFLGQGVTKKFRKQAINLAQKYKAPYKEGKTCIEGGNCHIFTASDGKPKAIIGYTSLILSFICLHTQGYFEQYKDRIMQPISSQTEPLSDDILRMAKNLNYFMCKKKCHIDEFIDEDVAADWTEMALQTREMIQITKEVISEELTIPNERIAYIFQAQFHIDMEVFVGPDDFVFVHDEEQMLALQETIDIEEMPFLKRTLEFSTQWLKNSQILLKENTKILNSIGCKVVPVPGVLTASYLAKDSLSSSYISSFWTSKNCKPFGPSYDSDTEILEKCEFPYMLNFMNGIFLKPNLFMTIAAPDHPITSLFQETFYKKVKDACPQLNILFLEESLLRTLTHYKGGLHCLTSKLQGLAV